MPKVDGCQPLATGKGATVVCVTPAMDHPLTAPLTVSLDGHEYSDNSVDIGFTPVKLEPLVGLCRSTLGRPYVEPRLTPG
jgi:hypothetical protein